MASFHEPGRGWRYDFRMYGRRHRAPRAFRTKKLCDAAERALRDRLQRVSAGIPDDAPGHGPRFSEWAAVCYTYAAERRRLRSPESFDHVLRVILRFWGAEPSDPAKVVKGEPYHDLTLDAPIRDGRWLLRFEEWMAEKGLSGSTKNHYRSACSRLYAVAMLPEYRTQSGIMLNPFRGILRDQTRRRDATFSLAQLRDVLGAAPPELALAIQIALLAPKLRLANITALRWDANLDRELTWIRLREHKTADVTGRPLVTPIVPALRALLAAVQPPARQVTRRPWVINVDGAPVKPRQIQRALERVCRQLEIPYGLAADGVTFHSLRHTAATQLAAIGVPEALRKDAIGHRDIQTTQRYTHLTPSHELAPLELLAAAFAPAMSGVNSGGTPKLAGRKRARVTRRPARQETPAKSRKTA
ncbi:MAG: site-specific integrase [Vicinamibacterales bacterium]|nr:site-specific integrase [Vicinamibacterales bacterium]